MAAAWADWGNFQHSRLKRPVLAVAVTGAKECGANYRKRQRSRSNVDVRNARWTAVKLWQANKIVREASADVPSLSEPIRSERVLYSPR